MFRVLRRTGHWSPAQWAPVLQPESLTVLARKSFLVLAGTKNYAAFSQKRRATNKNERERLQLSFLNPLSPYRPFSAARSPVPERNDGEPAQNIVPSVRGSSFAPASLPVPLSSSLTPRWVANLNEAIGHYPIATFVSLACLEGISFYGTLQVLKAMQVELPHAFVVAYLLSMPLRRSAIVKVTMAVPMAWIISKIFPSLTRVHISSLWTEREWYKRRQAERAVAAAKPSSSSLSPSRFASYFASLPDRYGLALFISYRVAGCVMVNMLYLALRYGFDVTPIVDFAQRWAPRIVTNSSSFQVGNYAGAVVYSALWFPLTVMLAPYPARIMHKITQRILGKKKTQGATGNDTSTHAAAGTAVGAVAAGDGAANIMPSISPRSTSSAATSAPPVEAGDGAANIIPPVDPKPSSSTRSSSSSSSKGLIPPAAPAPSQGAGDGAANIIPPITPKRSAATATPFSSSGAAPIPTAPSPPAESAGDGAANIIPPINPGGKSENSKPRRNGAFILAALLGTSVAAAATDDDADPAGATMLSKLAPASLRFRSASLSDLPSVVSLLVEDELGATREAAPTASQKAGVTKVEIGQEYTQAMSEILAQSSNEVVLCCCRTEEEGGVGKSNEQVIGVLQLTYIPNLTLRGTKRCLIEGVRVSASLRGQGVGRLLFLEAERRAKDRGCKLMQLTTNKQRTDAQRFYEQMGYKATHIGYKKALD
jgi:GNAT superfamily N-acetyltransferase